jgi:DNA repair exonuclease SbcCD ATPase subunit
MDKSSFLTHLAKGLMYLLERTRTGLKEMPSNAVWLLSRALKPVDAVEDAAGSAAASARDQGRKIEAAVIDAAPLGGDSVEIKLRRAQDVAERAREAEERAREAAQDSKSQAEKVKKVSERGHTRLREVERETERQIKQRIAEAQRTAEEFVRVERQAAEAEAEEQRREAQEEVENEIADAHDDAEEARHAAEELVADASEKLVEARRIADEAARAARAAAEEAEQRALAIAGQAERQAAAAEDRVKTTEQLRDHLVTTARETARDLNRETANGGLNSYSKAELVDLAAAAGISGRSNMTKQELVTALGSTPRKHEARS